MTPADAKWRHLPVLIELHQQWMMNRAGNRAEAFQRPFSRDWEKLLDAAGLVFADQRQEAERDARLLAAAGLVKLKPHKRHPRVIERISLPLEAEHRLRELFPEFHSQTGARLDLAGVDWAPEMRFVMQGRVLVNPEDLLRLNVFFKESRNQRPIVPIKERSLQIFGDEKRLDDLLSTALFGAGRLSLHLLRCEKVGEPFGWRRGPGDTGRILAIENAATWHSYTRWNAQHGFFSAVVYGRGNCFCDSLSYLADILTEFVTPQRVYYFGDLDAQGLRIPAEACEKAPALGLPRIEPDLWSYRHLLAAGQSREAAPEAAVPVSEKEWQWLGPLAEAVRELLAQGRRLPQEHIGWEFLSAQSGWGD